HQGGAPPGHRRLLRKKREATLKRNGRICGTHTHQGRDGMAKPIRGARSRRASAALLLAPGLSSFFVAPASAQVPASGDVQRQLEKQMRQYDEAWRLEVPADATFSERLLLDYGASARFGLYSIDDAGSHGHTLRQYDGRAWVRADLDGMNRIYARFKFQYD